MIEGQPHNEKLSRLEQVGLVLFFVAVIVFGGIVEMRSAFLQRRMTDADDFFRAAWGIRTGADIYSLTETNGWHYNYPPLFAIALWPLANPPPDAPRQGYLPYAVSVAIWYAASIVWLAIAVHWLASALERAVPQVRSPRGSRRWWRLRILPVIVCLVSIGRTLSRGQSNTLVLLLFCGMCALLLSNRRVWAGVCLAAAICIKVWPAFLLLYPAWRRDVRFIIACAAAVFGGLIFVPAIVCGPTRALEQLHRYAEVTLLPGLGMGQDRTRAEELTTPNGTDSESFLTVLHNFVYPNLYQRPFDAAPWERAVHWMIAAIVTGLTFFFGRNARGDPIAETLLLGSLMVVVLPISPVCHGHYFMLALPLVMGLIAHEWVAYGRVRAGMIALFVAHFVLQMASSLPLFVRAKEFGLPMFATMALWLAALSALRTRATPAQSLVPAEVPGTA